ncbi:hypothetical protein SELMODRAFT_111918 [Selaginella moellendorffii]|uniref:Pentatricopeptide repeat-containing protein n=1 Tax=Selaginella moellendorffii TaxID=88036 RepID=D8S9G8_SELML|nr:hypothetical protein SELMODRAFT_111918 [Selaginella moellendorffii]
MPEKDVVAQTTMLQAFAHNGVVEKATKIFDVILDKDERSISLLLLDQCSCGLLDDAEEIINIMLLIPDVSNWGCS